MSGVMLRLPGFGIGERELRFIFGIRIGRLRLTFDIGQGRLGLVLVIRVGIR